MNRTDNDKVLESDSYFYLFGGLSVSNGFNFVVYPTESYRMASNDFIRDLNDMSLSRL